MLARKIVICAIALFSVASAHANGNNGSSAEVYGEVVETVPIKEIVRTPVREQVCRDVDVRRRSSTGPIVGGIVGGIIGNQFGSGNGRTATTIAGAVLGGSVAADRQRNNSVRRQCKYVTRYTESERIIGYRVTYRYDGELHTTETSRDPGDFIRLKLSLAPA